MNLAIDIGNTTTKFGLFDSTGIKEVLKQENALSDIIARYQITCAIISQTGANSIVEAYLQQQGITYLVLSHQLKLPITIRYATPQTLGADRLAGSVAASALFPGNNVLKIDFGTCITYDFVNDKSEYLGGAISPGMAMRFKALNHYTAALPLVQPQAGVNTPLTGADTTSSILSGVVNGIKEEVDGIINEYKGRFGGLKVVVTGGDSEFLGALLKNEIFARPYLVLEGLNTILNYNA